MNKTTKIIIGVVVLILIIGFAWYSNKNQQQAINKEPIKIGFVGPLTGDAASYGQGEQNVVEMAIGEINLAGGINGRSIEVIYEDGKCSGKDAASAAQKLINIDKVRIILGGACSGETLAMAPITEQSKTILFAAFPSSPDITNAGDFVFRNAPSDLDQGKRAAQMIYDDGIKNIAILSENTDYGLAFKKVFKEEFIRLGGEIMIDELYNQNDKDYRTQLVKIKSKNPEAIFINPQSGISAGLAAKQTREMGINVPLYGTVGFSSGDALKTGGEALEGLVFSDTPILNIENLKARDFWDKFKSKYSAPASDYEIGARYDSVYIIANAVRKCGENTECIRDYLYNLKDYDGVIGKYHFDSNGDVIGIQYIIKEIRDGKVIERK